MVGTGYVGLVVGACLAETGHRVICTDVDSDKIDGLRQNILPVYEPGLGELVERNQTAERLAFTTDASEGIASSDVVFIAVGAPADEDSAADLKHVLSVVDTIGKHMARETVVVTNTTVPVGTGATVDARLRAQTRFPYHVVSNPEFLNEGAAVAAFMKPDRIVLGVESDHARGVMAELYAPFVRAGKPMVFMDIASAELTKCAPNAMLAVESAS